MPSRQQKKKKINKIGKEVQTQEKKGEFIFKEILNRKIKKKFFHLNFFFYFQQVPVSLFIFFFFFFFL